MRQETDRQFPTQRLAGGIHHLPPRIRRASNFEARVMRGRIVNGGNGERLVLSPKTIRNQVSTIIGKLGVNGRAQVIIKARDAGLGGAG